MKKPIAVASIALLGLSTTLAQTSVKDIPPKDDQFENTVTIKEFNSIVDTLRGLYNFFSDDKFQLGVNEPTPAQNLTLDVGGKVGAEAFCDANGENCIDPATWSARPQLELTPPGANCAVRYRIKDAQYQSDWQETSLGGDPIGKISRLHSGLKNNCSGNGCGVQMALRCTPNLAVTEKASCRLRYHVNHLKNPTLTPWVTTETTNNKDWQEGPWSKVVASTGHWGDGLNLEVGLNCAEAALRCQVGYKLHNEVEALDWQLTELTKSKEWSDGALSQLSADTVRACDQRVGCGLQMQTRCVGTTSTLKTALYKCPYKKTKRCPSFCSGQISLENDCSYQKTGANGECNVLLSENCQKIGHLVQ